MNFVRLAIILGVAINAAANSGPSEDQKLGRFFREQLDAEFELNPVEATSLGEHRYDHLLGDVSPAGRARRVEHLRTTLEALPQQVDRSRLTRAGQIDYEVLEHNLRKNLWLAETFEPFETDPRVYSHYISGSVYDLLASSSLPVEINVSNAIARIRQVPGILHEARATLKNPPRVCVETAILQNKGSISFYERDLYAIAGKTRQLATLKSAASGILPALREYQAYLETELLPRANGDWRIGPSKFDRKFQLEMDAGISADEVYATAQTEFTRVQNEMYVIARQLWSRYFPREAIPPDDMAGRRAVISRTLGEIARDHSSAGTLVRDIRREVGRIKRFIAEYDILTLPTPDLCRVIEMPEFQRGNSTAFMNSPPPLDAKATGYYAVSPPPKDWDAERAQSLFEEYNRKMIQILTIHEAYPGHYVQMEYANRHPSLIRKVLGSGVFVEGWAVYAEQTMLDQGYGDGDLALRLTQLKFYLRAVGNAILDHQMHCGNMTDTEAMDLLVNQAFQTKGEAQLKVIRARQSSVQLSTYFTGRMAHYRLRQEVEREMGDRFALGRYHEAVLTNGAVPMKFLPELVREQLGLPGTSQQ